MPFSAELHEQLLTLLPSSFAHPVTCLFLQICTTLGALPGEVGGAEVQSLLLLLTA